MSRQCSISEGGLIPKTMYLPIEELEKQKPELCGGMDSIYHCVSLARGQVGRPGADIPRTDLLQILS